MTDTTWWYAQGDQKLGPIPWATLVSLAQTGVVLRDTLVWTASMATWQPAHAVDAMAHLFSAPPPLPNQPPPLPSAPPLSAPRTEMPAQSAGTSLPQAHQLAKDVSTSPWSMFARRLAAASIDMVLVAAVTVVLPGVLLPEYALWHEPEVLSFKVIWLTALPSIAYPLYLAGMISTKGTTWGKRLLGLRVTTWSGEHVSFWRALGRTCAQTYGFMTLGIGWLMPLWTKQRQALHDMMAATVVVREGSDERTDAWSQESGAMKPWQIAALMLAVPLSVAPDLFSATDFALTRHRANELHQLATGVADKVTEQFDRNGRVPTLASLGVNPGRGDTQIELEEETAIITVTNRKTQMTIELFPSRPGDTVQWQCTFTHSDNVALPFPCQFRSHS